MGIIVENVSKLYNGKTVLNNVSLKVNDGDFTVLLAPTGAGKTTLLRIIAGIESPDSGKVYYDGVDVTGVSVQKRSIAMVYQQFINYPSMTIYENIASPLRVSKKKYSEKEIDKKVRENAELLGITKVLDHLPEEVSGGQQQRTAIARALTKDAKYIFLDEPLANLDYKLREEMRGELKLILRNKTGAIMYATPEPLDALGMGTHVGFMHEGEILQHGPVQEVYKNPQYVEVGSYFCYPTMNIFDGKLIKENSHIFLKISDELKINVDFLKESLSKDSYLLGIHAHAVSTFKEKEHMVPIRATVQLSEVVGSDTELHMLHHDIKIIVLMQELVTYDLGEEIDLYIDTGRFYIFDKSSRRLVGKTFNSESIERKGLDHGKY